MSAAKVTTDDAGADAPKSEPTSQSQTSPTMDISEDGALEIAQATEALPNQQNIVKTSAVDALIEEEIRSFSRQIEAQTVAVRPELLGRDRYGRGYYFFNAVPGIFVAPAPEQLRLSNTAEESGDGSVAATDEQEISRLSAFGVKSGEALPADLVVCISFALRCELICSRRHARTDIWNNSRLQHIGAL